MTSQTLLWRNLYNLVQGDLKFQTNLSNNTLTQLFLCQSLREKPPQHKDDVFFHEHHSSRAAPLPHVPAVRARRNKTPAPAITAASAPRGQATAQGSHSGWSPALDLPGRTQSQQKPHGGRQCDLEGRVCGCSHPPCKQLCFIAFARYKLSIIRVR